MPPPKYAPYEHYKPATTIQPGPPVERACSSQLAPDCYKTFTCDPHSAQKHCARCRPLVNVAIARRAAQKRTAKRKKAKEGLQ